jgi:hypothetical protein
MNTSVERAVDSKPDDSWGIVIYNAVFGDQVAQAEKLASMGRGWFKYITKIQVTQIGDCVITPQLELPLGREMPWPFDLNDTGKAKKTSHWNDALVLFDHPDLAEFKAAAAAYTERVGKAKARQREFVDSVKTIVHTYSTLAPALKAWPPLWELLPLDVQIEHKKVVTKDKQQKQELVAAIDFDKITAMSAASKLGV